MPVLANVIDVFVVGVGRRVSHAVPGVAPGTQGVSPRAFLMEQLRQT